MELELGCIELDEPELRAKQHLASEMPIQHSSLDYRTPAEFKQHNQLSQPAVFYERSSRKNRAGQEDGVTEQLDQILARSNELLSELRGLKVAFQQDLTNGFRSQFLKSKAAMKAAALHPQRFGSSGCA